MKYFLLPVLFCCVFLAANAQDERTTDQTRVAILKSVDRPTGFSVPHAASFVTIDKERFGMGLTVPDDGLIRLPLNLPGIGTVEAEVKRYRVFDALSQLVAMTENGPVPYAPPTSVLVRGTIPSIPGSFVVMAIYPNWATGYIDMGEKHDHKNFLVSPLSIEPINSVMIIYDRDDSKERYSWTCSTEEPKALRMTRPKGQETEQVRYRIITVALEGDEPYYIDHGRNLTKATQYAESVVAASSAIYERDLTATIRVGQLYIWTTTDPYPGTTTSTLLPQFRDRWRTNYGAVVRTTAHLLSGINSIGGIAYVQTMCDKDYGYAVSGLNNNITYPATGYVWDTDVFSHETGHNVGSPHTFNCGWNPPIDSCVAAEGGTCYTGTKAVKGTIMSYCHLTAQGTNLNFHPRVINYMKTMFTDACTPLTYELKVTLTDTVRACRGSLGSVSAVATAGATPYSYRWIGAGFDTVTTSGDFSFPVKGHYFVFLTVTDAVGNTVKDSVLVFEKIPPEAKIDASATKLCIGSSVDLTCIPFKGQAPFNYQWFRNWSPLNNPTEMVSQRLEQPATFQVILSDATGCSDTAEITVKTYDLQAAIDPPSLALPPLTVCANPLSKSYTIRNIGTDTIKIDSILTGNSISVRTTLPVVIAPGGQASLMLTITVKGVGTIRDEIAFIDSRCLWRFRTAVTGTRPVAKIFSKLPFDLGTKIKCDTPTVRTVFVGINNPSTFPMQVVEVYSRYPRTKVWLDGPATIPPGSDKTVPISILPDLDVNTATDTLSLIYLSDACEGKFYIPLTMRESSISLAYPQALSFDTVKTSQQVVNKTFSITPTITGAQRSVIADVQITEPFATTLQPGVSIQHNKATPVVVSIAPSSITQSGLIKGQLTFSIDSCLTTYTVDLSATNVLVGVDDQIETSATLNVVDGAIVVGAEEGVVYVYDMRGLVVATTNVGAENTGKAIIRNLPSGAYVVVHQSGGSLRRTLGTVCIHM